MKSIFKPIFAKGFTLVEMAVVLVIIGLTIGSLTATITAQVEHKAFSETKDTLENVKEALLGYAMANGRLPCPAQTPGTGITGVEYFASGGSATNGNCGQFYTGYVPAVTLGVTPTDTSGYVLDAWGNPIRYAVFNLMETASSTNHLLTSTDGIKNANNTGTATSCSSYVGMAFTSCMSLLYVCSTSATGSAIASDCGSATSLISSTSLTGGAVFVVFSTGKNAATGGTSNNEAANLNDDPVFVSRDISSSADTNGEYDDLVVWASANTIFSKLVQANKLP